MFRGKTYESEKLVATYDSYDSFKMKRYRSAFTTDQIKYLEKQFSQCPYIGSATRKEVANVLNIPERAIKIWFQNRRMKEKKEGYNKEYNLSPPNLTESSKHPLNNVNSSQSVNDRQCSLQLTTAKHVDKCNGRNYNDIDTFSNQVRIDYLKTHDVDLSTKNTFRNCGTMDNNNIKHYNARTSRSLSANITKKVHDNRNFAEYLERTKNGTPKSKMMNKRPVNLQRHQDLPVDLSSRNVANVMVPQNYQGNMSLNSAYIPFCNPQNVCLSAGNVLWKPVNVMPVISPNRTSVAFEMQQKKSKGSSQKCNCRCDCQTGKKMSYEPGNTASQPQYIIAIPYSNSPNLLR